MLNEQVKRLLNAPQLTETKQGIDSYPRVIRQDDAGDNHMLVTFSLPGLRRVRMWTPLATWIAGDHLDCHDAMVNHLSKLLPPRDMEHPS